MGYHVLAPLDERVGDGVGRLGLAHEHHADAAVEGAQHLGVGHLIIPQQLYGNHRSAACARGTMQPDRSLPPGHTKPRQHPCIPINSLSGCSS